jgi:GT2 family glycosyltransferase
MTYISRAQALIFKVDHLSLPAPSTEPAGAPAWGIPGLVSVVIVNYNRRDDLRQALLSVRLQDYPHLELIVVDNVSTDGSREMIDSEFPEAQLIRSDQNLGMDGYSVGFRQAKGEFIFQMDNDSEIPDPTVLSQVVDRFQRGPEFLGVVATRVEEFRPGVNDVEELRQRDTRRGPLDLRAFHSGGVGFRRRALHEAGGYNRDIFLYCAEMFLEMSLLAAGYSLFTYPEILMLHKGSPVARSSSFLYYHVRNRLWFLRCFGTPMQRARYMPTMLLYDFSQALWKRSAGAYFRGVREGLGQLPGSLKRIVRSTRPDYVRRVDELGQIFRPLSLARRTITKLRGG